MYFRINLNKDGITENFSLYLKTTNSANHTPLYAKFIAVIISAPALFIPDTIEKAVLETMNFSNIPDSSTAKLQLKKSQTYALLGLYLGFLGLHDFYAGKKWKGFVHLLLTIPLGIFIIPAGISLLWAWWDLAGNNTSVETV